MGWESSCLLCFLGLSRRLEERWLLSIKWGLMSLGSGCLKLSTKLLRPVEEEEVAGVEVGVSEVTTALEGRG